MLQTNLCQLILIPQKGPSTQKKKKHTQTRTKPTINRTKQRRKRNRKKRKQNKMQIMSGATFVLIQEYSSEKCQPQP